MSNQSIDEKIRMVMESSPKPIDQFNPPGPRDMPQRDPSVSSTTFPESNGSSVGLYDPLKPDTGDGGGGGTEPLVGAFFGLYANKDGDTYLQCGSVTGGNGGSATVKDYKVLDKNSGVGSNAGKILVLRVRCMANIDDDSGVMLPGCTVLSASLAPLSKILDNHSFSVSSRTGALYTEIGRWTDAVFVPSSVGHVLASGCIGDFSLRRI